ncbi:hypothetical protein Hypma_000347 [Hypsizygus marmoreus]|uniref:Peptidase A1 domain-containing protein n=1 Tax=Hypsizygus marmoreus TaxID=39966 RepID=A0A369JCU6_HYPMA|nr:hypothetical protein Hypma_000347 [Hypsizygus marmoreus]
MLKKNPQQTYYIAAKYGTRSSNGNFEVTYWGLPAATTGEARDFTRSDSSLFDGFPAAPGILVHTGTNVISPPEPAAGSYGWYSAVVNASLLTQSTAFYYNATTVPNILTRPPDPYDCDFCSCNTFVNDAELWIFSDHITRPRVPVAPPNQPSDRVNIYIAKGRYGKPIQGWPVEDSETYDIAYVDGSKISYKLHLDDLYLEPAVKNPRENDDDYWVKILFGVVTSASEAYRFVSFEGVLGLAPDTNNKQGHISFMNQLVRERDILNPEVMIYVGAPSLYQNEGRSTLSFGLQFNFGLPSPIWKSVPIHNEWWKIKSPKKRLNRAEFDTTPNNLMFLDTGCAGIWLHEPFVQRVYNAIPGTVMHGNMRIFEKPTNIRSLPVVEIQMGENGEFLSLHPAAIIGSPVMGRDGWVEGTIQSTTSLSRDTSGNEYLGLAAMQSMWMKFQYSTEHWQKSEKFPYPVETEETKFWWAPKGNDLIM